MAKPLVKSTIAREGDHDSSAGDELLSFLLGGLAATRDSLERTLSLQQQMMEVVSRHAFAPEGGGGLDQKPEDMEALVTALQSDDLIRQTHENLVRALAVMAGAVEEGRGQDGGDPGRPSRRERWTAELLDSVLLEDLRDRFARRLGPLDDAS